MLLFDVIIVVQKVTNGDNHNDWKGIDSMVVVVFRCFHCTFLRLLLWWKDGQSFLKNDKLPFDSNSSAN
jgi:hypothetical protein